MDICEIYHLSKSQNYLTIVADKLNGIDIKMKVDIRASGNIMQTCLANFWEIWLGTFQSPELLNPYAG